ncbi:MAG: hypothetical protein V2J24_23570 [Pseudomonadales bacterium]|jgi:hypothetical protein|nr:hypothetical protein [Pseudomonadales bacterium]
MAVDTRDRRFSMMGLGADGEIPAPDGTIATADRVMLATLYPGITPGSPVVDDDPVRSSIVATMLRSILRSMVRGIFDTRDD